MSRVYATDEKGERFLRRIECDKSECPARIAPRSDIAESGWIKRGQDDGRGMTLEWDYCPEHAA